MFDPEILTLAESVLAAYRTRGWHVATAESCTGGLVAAALTAIAGSSDVVERGFVTYSNAAKSELLGVPADTIASHGRRPELASVHVHHDGDRPFGRCVRVTVEVDYPVPALRLPWIGGLGHA